MILSSLIERLEKAEGPDRELDLAVELFIRPQGKIADLMQFRRGFDGKDGMAWDIHHGGAVCFEQYRDGQCNYNGGYPLPYYSSSIDAALTLVPEGFKWKAGYSRHVPHNAEIQDYRANPVSGAFVGECDSNRAIALCIASLRARSAMTEEGS